MPRGLWADGRVSVEDRLAGLVLNLCSFSIRLRFGYSGQIVTDCKIVMAQTVIIKFIY